jgi:hypothetical protein
VRFPQTRRILELGGLRVPICVHSEYFPLVLLDLGATDRGEDDFRGMFAALHEANVRAMREKTWTVLIVSSSKVPSAGERKIIAEFSNRVPVEERRKLVAIGIISNPLLRGTITAFQWLIPGLPSLLAAADADDAVGIAARVLTKQGIDFDQANVALAAKWLKGRPAKEPLAKRV